MTHGGGKSSTEYPCQLLSKSHSSVLATYMLLAGFLQCHYFLDSGSSLHVISIPTMRTRATSEGDNERTDQHALYRDIEHIFSSHYEHL